MIVDASVVIDAVADPGELGRRARAALADVPAAEGLSAPGHLAFEVLSGLRAAANRPGHPLREEEVGPALDDVEALSIHLDPIPWEDVRRAWTLSQGSLRYADAIYVVTAERRGEALLTSVGRIGRAGAAITCAVITVALGEDQRSEPPTG